MYFNPLHHEGGDAERVIPAPVQDYFNPLHHEGGDHTEAWDFLSISYFNPLHHEGGDHGNPIIMPCSNQFQSTPPRGWRHSQDIYRRRLFRRFQSTPPRGWRQIVKILNSWDIQFQSTPPRGWRPSITHQSILIGWISIHSTTRVETTGSSDRPGNDSDFNPLHHEGGDPDIRKRHGHLGISIHSTTRVETKLQGDEFRSIMISIHSTTRVETAILHNNHYYSSTHFHKQIISHPLKSRPTIPLHSQIRSHCANFPVRISP
ncbi:Uncharacterised protein [Enterocloster clostridioformis]|uniref:Uncharacterized protein n=1 Tax=Enterocloster clostridioformis TaxID=1531 RepID=A0A174LZ16_9FIRM|nr:Uncharacterised protein [Enterocloster clostridioformis]